MTPGSRNLPAFETKNTPCRTPGQAASWQPSPDLQCRAKTDERKGISMGGTGLLPVWSETGSDRGCGSSNRGHRFAVDLYHQFASDWRSGTWQMTAPTREGPFKKGMALAKPIPASLSQYCGPFRAGRVDALEAGLLPSQISQNSSRTPNRTAEANKLTIIISVKCPVIVDSQLEFAEATSGGSRRNPCHIRC